VRQLDDSSNRTHVVDEHQLVVLGGGRVEWAELADIQLTLRSRDLPARRG